jgi:hypothetical protein
MLVAGQAQLTGVGAFYAGGYNYGGGANFLLGGRGPFGCWGGGQWGWGGQFGQLAGWGATWKSDIYDVQTGKAWDTTLASTLGRRDPVYLDTNRDGKLNVEGGKRIRFDINGDGIMDTVHEWNTKDAQLVYDANGNGKIDNGREIMNETSITGKQNAYKNGWEKTRDIFDKDKNGIVDGAELDKARFWTDANGNGKVDDGEMKTAKEMNIVSIDTKNGKFVTKEKVGEMHGFTGAWGGRFGGGWGGGWGGCGCGWGRSGWGFGGGNFGFGGWGGGWGGGHFGGYARYC